MSEDKAQGTISIKTYINFFRAGAHYLVLFFVFLLFIIAEVSVCANTGYGDIILSLCRLE